MVAAVVGLLMALPAEAQWKWRDKAGQTQYSDLPPPSTVPEQDILSRPFAVKARANAPGAAPAATTPGAVASGTAASSALAPKTVDAELEAKRTKAEADVAAKSKAEDIKIAAARTENCARARATMRSLESGVRIAHTNEKGEREVLDDKQRGDESRHTRDIIASDCK